MPVAPHSGRDEQKYNGNNVLFISGPPGETILGSILGAEMGSISSARAPQDLINLVMYHGGFIPNSNDSSADMHHPAQEFPFF